MRFRAESKDAIEEQIRLHLDPVFDDARGKAPAFADEVLGLEGKLYQAGGIVDKFLSDTVFEIGRLFGSTEMYEPKDWSDGFRRFARDRFPQTVLGAGDVERAVAAASSGYLARLQELENGLLVNLAVNVPEGAAGPDPSPPDMAVVIRAAIDPDLIAADLAGDANADAVGMILRGIVSDKVAEKVTEDQPDGFKKTATRFIVGNQVDNGLEAGMKAVGFDPASSLAARVRTSLDVALRTLRGSDDERQPFDQFIMTWLTHPDTDVRAAAGAAARAFETHVRAGLGLRPRLRSAYYARNLGLRRAVFREIIGEDAPADAFLLAKSDLPRDTALRWAREWTLFLEDPAAWRKLKESE